MQTLSVAVIIQLFIYFGPYLLGWWTFIFCKLVVFYELEIIDVYIIFVYVIIYDFSHQDL